MKSPTIIVCLKTVPDPEGPGSSYEIDCESKKVIPTGIPQVINPFDENALEVALSLKDLWGGSVVAISMAEKATAPVLQKSLAVGADALIFLDDPLFKDLDSRSTALVLSAAIKKLGSYDLILTGRQAADWDFGQVGLLVAEMLQIPGVNLAQKVELKNGTLIIEKLKRTGYEVVIAPTPSLVTVSSEAGELRMYKLKAFLDARKKPLTIWKITDLGIEPATLSTRNIWKLSTPPSRSRNCFLVEGDSPHEKARNLVLKLRQDQLI